MQGKAFWVIPGPLHVPSWGGKGDGPRMCAYAYVGVCESAEELKPWDPLLLLLHHDKSRKKRQPSPFLLLPNYSSDCYQQSICKQCHNHSELRTSFLRWLEDDEWRRRAASCGSQRKWLGVLTERRQLRPGGRLHRAADTCPVRLALQHARSWSGERGGGGGAPFCPPPPPFLHTVNTSFSHPHVLPFSTSSPTFRQVGQA